MTPGKNGNLRLGRRVAAVSIGASCVLSALNIGIGYVAGSTSVVAAGFEFLGNVVSSVLVLAGMILAAKPADAEHPYGHGRIEILAGLSVGLILAAGGAGICYRSLQKFGRFIPRPRYPRTEGPLLAPIREIPSPSTHPALR
jgi:cation diffusion facilitator family transporter